MFLNIENKKEEEDSDDDDEDEKNKAKAKTGQKGGIAKIFLHFYLLFKSLISFDFIYLQLC